APLDRRNALNFAVRGAVRVLDLLPAPSAAIAKNDHASECAGHDGGSTAVSARHSRGAAEAEKSDHGHYAAQSGHRRHAAGRGASAFYAGHARNAARGPGPLGLPATGIGVSHDPRSVAREKAVKRYEESLSRRKNGAGRVAERRHVDLCRGLRPLRYS